VGALEIARTADGAQTDKEQQQRTELKSVPGFQMVSLNHKKKSFASCGVCVDPSKLRSFFLPLTADVSEKF
jgi:hypothetical protein